MLRCTGEERVSEPFLSSIGGPWGVFLDPSFVYMSQDTWGSQLFKGNNNKPHGDYWTHFWGIWWFKSQEPWSWSLLKLYMVLPSFIKDDLVPNGSRVSAGPQNNYEQNKAQFSSVQALSRVPLCGTPWSHARLPCSSPSPGVYSNSCPSSQWCHPTISSSVVPFSSCPQPFPASGSFPMSQLFASGGQRTGVSASASKLICSQMPWTPVDSDDFIIFRKIHWHLFSRPLSKDIFRK